MSIIELFQGVALGLKREAFKTLVDSLISEALVANKKEDLVNGAEETPTIFFNGRRWVGDFESAEIVDALEEEVSRIKGERWLTD